jgi:1,4-dihydroxy-2-naphthoyl-CoA hydrolase
METKSIWFNPSHRLEDLRQFGKGTMSDHLGLEWVEIGPDFLKLKMPVDHRTIQPFGLLHGGANCVLAETIGSVASYMVIDPSRFITVGQEINANHLRSATSGWVTATVTPLHLGRTTHVWDIRIKNDENKMVCISRLTVAVREKGQGG